MIVTVLLHVVLYFINIQNDNTHPSVTHSCYICLFLAIEARLGLEQRKLIINHRTRNQKRTLLFLSQGRKYVQTDGKHYRP